MSIFSKFVKSQFDFLVEKHTFFFLFFLPIFLDLQYNFRFCFRILNQIQGIKDVELILELMTQIRNIVCVSFLIRDFNNSFQSIRRKGLTIFANIRQIFLNEFNFLLVEEERNELKSLLRVNNQFFYQFFSLNIDNFSISLI